MTIRSTTSNTPCSEKELPFPKLMVANGQVHIVLFTSSRSGTIVGKGKYHREVGFHTDDWYPSGFKDFKGSVCLENSDKS